MADQLFMVECLDPLLRVTVVEIIVESYGVDTVHEMRLNPLNAINPTDLVCIRCAITRFGVPHIFFMYVWRQSL